MQCRGAVNAVTWKKNKKNPPSTLPFFLYFPLLLSSLLSEPDFRHLAAQASDIDVEDDTASPKDMSVSVSLSIILSLSFFSNTLALFLTLSYSLLCALLHTYLHIVMHFLSFFFFLPPANLNPCIYWVTCTRKIWTPQVNAAHCYALDLFVLESRTLIMKTHNRDIQGCSGS